MSAVDEFWTRHTVRDEPFTSAAESLAYLDWRSEQYPFFHDLMGLWGDHSGQTVMDYGCGPANDMVGFLVHGKADQVIGVDISPTALDLAARRLALHGGRWDLRRVSDDEPVIPIESGSIDYIYCEGVLHHTSHPETILAEFARVLRPGGSVAIMVYNFDSLWTYLVSGPDPEAFRRSTDGEDCPVSIAYRPGYFTAMCRAAGLPVTFRGGYFTQLELARWRAEPARVPLVLDIVDGFPYHKGLPAGIGGVYR